MTVMECCFGPFFPHFLGSIALGFLLCLLLRLSVKKTGFLMVGFFVAFRTFEGISNWVYEGRIAGRWALYLGLLTFGLFLGSTVYWGVRTLREKRKAEEESSS
ncbi:MAG TPA: hypothetical protein H9844_08405 [Candidatus Evtepia faecigallinarum]|nr:hypothetical protein [Candidatus Evtepia faecigallinarum]